jgi:hypothetical protein
MTLKYIFIRAQTIILTVKGPNEEIAVSLKKKEILFRITVFPIMGQQNNIFEPEIP